MSIQKRIRSGNLYSLFNFKEERALGRSCMLLSSALSSVISWLTTGLFYTSFLMANGIDVVKIGIITFVPYIANCASIFSPSILERFARRKGILSASRAAYYTLNILAITVMPRFVTDPTARMSLFVLFIFAANIINALFTSGYQVWQVNFIPENVRAGYFSVNTLFTAFIGCGAALASSVVADALAASAYQDTILVIFRYIAYAFGLLDVFILARPKEYPYLRSATVPRLRDIFVKPVQNKKFALTMLIVFFWNVAISVPNASLNYYLINDVGVSYTFIYVINMFYPLFLLLFLPAWNRLLRRWGWLRTFAYAALLHTPTNLLYSCATAANFRWVIPTVRLTQHLFGVGMNVAYANMVYLNLPAEDQTNYISFHTLVLNGATFLGIMAGTWFVSAFPELRLQIGGLTFVNHQMLLWVNALGNLLVPLAVLKLLPRLTPDTATTAAK